MTNINQKLKFKMQNGKLCVLCNTFFGIPVYVPVCICEPIVCKQNDKKCDDTVVEKKKAVRK